MPERLQAPFNAFLLASGIKVGATLGVVAFVPMTNLFIYLLMLMTFNMIVAFAAVVMKPNVSYRAFLNAGIRKFLMIALARFCYITDAHMGDVSGMGIALGPIATSWFIVHIAITSLKALDQCEVPLGPFKRVLEILEARAVQMEKLPSISEPNPAAPGSLLEKPKDA